MIDIGKLEERYKLNEKMKTKKENQNITERAKPRIPKPPKIHPIPQSIQDKIDRIESKRYTEYRSMIKPLLAGTTWKAYQLAVPDATNDEYNQIMRRILTSKDLTDLLEDKLSYFDTDNGYLKLITTPLAFCVECGSKFD